MKPPRIIKPYDWQRLQSPPLFVVIEGESPPDCRCVLWSREAYATLEAAKRPVLASAEVVVVTPDLQVACIWKLDAWGECVLGVVASPEHEVVAACGVILGGSAAAVWTAEVETDAKDRDLTVLYPLPLGCATQSHFASDRPTQFAEVWNEERFWKRDDTAPFAITRLDEVEVVDAMASLRLGDCVGIDMPKWIRLQCQSPYLSSPTYVARFRDAFLTLPGGVLAAELTGIWSDSAIAPFFNDPNLAHHPAIFRGSEGYGIALHSVKALTGGKDGRPDGAPLLLSNTASVNSAHWLVNSLYAAFRLKDKIISGDVFVLISEPSRYMLEGLELLGIPKNRICVSDPGIFALDDAYFPSSLSTHGNFFPPKMLARMFRELAERAPHTPESPTPLRKIYVTRMGSGAQRRIKNEEELIRNLCTRGFSIIAPHKLSLLEIIDAFSQAEVVVGQLGAGLANIGFCPPGCNVVEISSHNYTSNDYWFMSHILRHRFTRILVSDNSTNDFDLSDFLFEVPLASTLGAVDRVLASP